MNEAVAIAKLENNYEHLKEKVDGLVPKVDEIHEWVIEQRALKSAQQRRITVIGSISGAITAAFLFFVQHVWQRS